jgi:AcrR family transcriptional regulator
MGDMMRKKDDEKKNRIKKAVVQIILAEGFHGTSISKIAKVASVSPATVYIYYENKEEMLKDIYLEYAEDFHQYLVSDLAQDLSGEEFIDCLVRHYYQYMISHPEIFHFIDQFNACPALSQGCKALSGTGNLTQRISLYKKQGIIFDYDCENIFALLFYPVKAIANKAERDSVVATQQLDEMIMIIQKAILR